MWIVGKEAQLSAITLAVVKDHRALPAVLLIVVQLAEVSDDVLAWPGIRPHTLDKSVVGVRLAILGSCVGSKKHGGLLVAHDGGTRPNVQGDRSAVHEHRRVPLRYGAETTVSSLLD